MSDAGCTNTYCPFSQRDCTECAVYRGRHRYTVFTRHNDGTEDKIRDYFQGMEALSDPWADKITKSEEELKIQIRLIDAESGKARPCDLDEARTWDWGDPETLRIINDRQVKSFENLINILCHKEEQGHREVDMYEFPRFMFLCGG